jgi:hypothetical protein
MKVVVIVLATILITSFEKKSDNLLTTSSAVEKYSNLLKNKTFLVFPELRENPIKWFDSIPEEKIRNVNLTKSFSMSAQPGEFYAYQVGVWAFKSKLDDIQVEFSDLKTGNSDKIIPARVMTCFNKGGLDMMGKAFTKTVNVQPGRLQALWMGIDLNGVKEGNYKGSVSVIAEGKKQTIPIQLEVSGDAVPNHGYNIGNHLSRLNWLNSTVGINEEITKGYLPVKIDGNKINILGRTVIIAETGLPSSIISYFGPSNQSFVEKGEPIVNNALRFIIENEDGTIIQLKPGKLVFSGQTPSKINWKVLNTSVEFDLECTGQMEFDGFIDYQLKLKAKLPLKVKDIRLEIPVVNKKAEYMMGLGHEGGLLASDWKWKWDVSMHQDMLWVGAVNGGVHIKWKAENYVLPIVNVYYALGKLNLPPSWGNEGKGGVDIVHNPDDVVINAYSGTREIRKVDVLNYDFELLITPAKLINKKSKFGDRYGGGTIESVKASGANIIKIHHGTEFIPFINYPYLDETVAGLTRTVADAHKEGFRMNFYYTTRELTKNIPEFWAFNSLNGEIVFPGPGDRNPPNRISPSDWLIKNLKEKFIAAWFTTVKAGVFKDSPDIAVITTPDSRLNNFYAAGLDWLVQNVGNDGVYIDDTALDRFTLRRARKIIDRYHSRGTMDMHLWNHFDKLAGYANSLNLYMDLLPYVDLVMIGEGRDYDRAPDHWLIEVSGIPFGLPGMMLGAGSNPWRGMVYGISTRGGNPTPDIWKFWDQHQIENKEMIGYWEKDNPVACYNQMIKATLYKGDDESIIAIANWYKEEQPVNVVVDFKKLGYDPANCDIIIPEIPNYQKQYSSFALDKMMIPGGKGYIILIKKKN